MGESAVLVLPGLEDTPQRIDHTPSEPIILGQPPPKTSYRLEIPNTCTNKQLAIFLTGFLRSMGVGFEFTDQEYRKIDPKIRGWFNKEQDVTDG